MESSRYDAIVIGAGIAGLSCAAHLAKAGKKVVVFEQTDHPGGLWTSFVRSGIVFDVGPHWTVEATRINNILDDLDAKPVTFMPVQNLGRYIGPDPGSDIVLSKYRETLERTILHSYPGVKSESIAAMTDLAMSVDQELSRLPSRYNQAPSLFRRLTRRARQTFSRNPIDQLDRLTARQLLASLFPGKELKGLRTALAMIVPLPNGSAIDLLSAIAMALTGRAYAPVGGAQRMATAFADAVTRNGGRIEYSTRVAAIQTQGHQVTGVVLEDGQEVEAACVISAVDARQTFLRLLDPHLLPRSLKRKLERSKPGGSVFFVSLVTDLDPSAHGFDGTDVFLLRSDDFNEALKPNDPERSTIQLTFPRFRTTEFDHRIHGIQIVVPATFENEETWHTGPQLERGEPYQDFKAEYARRLIGQVEKYIPGLRDHVLEMDIATPISIHRYTLNDRGASSGWENPGYWKQKTPSLTGLYQAGHWVAPPGAYHAALSGQRAAAMVLKGTQKA